MGRRSLRKVDPALDLSRHLMTFEQLPCPWNSEALFGRTGPLEVEVGSGKGLFLRSAAAAQPGIDFLGIEIVVKYARFAAAGLATRELGNARVVAADALRVFRELLPSECLDAVHVYFPDPWWKKRHKKRRVMQESFIEQIERTLRPGGLLHFWTDVEEYFHTSLELLATHPRMEGPQEVPEASPESDMDYRTHFERRMRLNEKPVYRSQFLKRPILPPESAEAAQRQPTAADAGH